MPRTNAAATPEGMPVRGIGDNRPPSPVEIFKEALAEKYTAELAKIGPIADRANAAPAAIKSDDELALWGKISVDASTLFKQLDEARKNEKRPMTEAVDGFFADSKRLERIVAAAQEKGTAWNRAKAAKARAEQEAEAQRLREEAEAKRIAAEFEMNEATSVIAAGEAAALEVRAEVVETPQTAADLTRVKADGVMATTATTWSFEIVDASKIDLNAIRMFIDPKAIETAIRKIVRTQKGATKIEGVRVFQDETAQFRRG